MANSFSASFLEVRAKEMQTVFHKTNVGLKIADTSFNSTMKSGDTLNRVYRSSNRPQVYTRGTAITINDKTDTNESLSITSQYADGFYVDSFDKIQSNYDAAMLYGKDAGQYLSDQIDADILGEVTNATSDVDDGTIGGTSGNGLTLATNNVIKVLGAVKKKLKKQNVNSTNLFGAISPEFEDILTQYVEGRETAMWDKLGENGYVGRRMGIDMYVSNNLTGSAVLALATQPTANDTVVIAGQTFTFVSSIGTTPGNVLIGANVDVTRASLATLINAPSTTTSTGVALTGENLKLFQSSITAVNDNAANTLTVTQKGAGAIAVSEVLTDGTDTWTTAKIKQHNLFGVKGNPTAVIQKEPSLTIREVPDKLGVNILNGVLYGVKTFADNAKAMVNVELNASAF